jgi:hypothetical protein
MNDNSNYTDGSEFGDDIDVTFPGEETHVEEPVEEPGDEPVDETPEEPGDEPIEEPIDETSSEEPVEEPSSDPEMSEDEAETYYFEELSESTGFEIRNDDDIRNAFLELGELRDQFESAQETRYDHLPKDLQVAIKTAESGGNYRSIMELANKDFSNMDGKDVLFEQYLKNNPNVAKRDANVARLRFDNFYQANYGVLDKLSKITDEDDRQEFLENNKSEIDRAKMLFEDDVSSAREEMESFKEENSVPADTGGYTEQEVQQFLEEHNRSIDNALADFSGIDLSLGDGDEVFTLGVNEEQVDNIRDIMSNPSNFFEEVFGISKMEGQIENYDKFLGVIALIQNADRIVNSAGQYYMEKADRSTLEKLLENPAPETKSTQKNTDPLLTEDEELVKAIRNANPIRMK